MQRSDFNFDLPRGLIAQVPLAERTASRLLHVAGETLHDRQFLELPNLLRAGDLLVFNNTRVIPARLRGHKQTGGEIEVLVERVLDDSRVLAHVRASKSPRPGSHMRLEDSFDMEMLARQGELFELALVEHDASILNLLERHGHMPLPPYISREDTASDAQRYQTVYAQHSGAVAAPTAGLHFDEAMLAGLDTRGIRRCEVTLHVGAGTFQPLRVDELEDHHMHSEWFEVTQAVVDAVADTRACAGRVIAVGTTSVRALESAAQANKGKLAPFRGETDIFIYPGYDFQVVDCMLTNFHLPESTLIMLVSAFAGYENIMHAYKHAIEQQYRFFSYGDSMFLERETTQAGR